jgi:anthranilate synthase component II
MITVVDNYDSFTYNLVQQIERLASERVRVVRNDEFDPDELLRQRPEAIVISPGPGTPSRAGRVLELIRANESIPLLGVCLGHQAIGEAFGAKIVRGSVPVHGKVTPVFHTNARLFADCEVPLQTARYHSLVIERNLLPRDLYVDAETEDRTVMAVSHRNRPMFGIQFHPESFGTIGGDQIIRNFLAMARAGRSREPGVGGSNARVRSRPGDVRAEVIR